MREIPLRCYAHTLPDATWYAHCIDLTLDTRGATFEEARARLDEVILGYLRTVVAKGWEDQMIPRLSPFRFRLTYYLIALATYWRGLPLLPRKLRELDTFGRRVPAYS
jgi:predicted RNase H-like HicB family nuclease